MEGDGRGDGIVPASVVVVVKILVPESTVLSVTVVVVEAISVVVVVSGSPPGPTGRGPQFQSSLALDKHFTQPKSSFFFVKHS